MQKHGEKENIRNHPDKSGLIDSLAEESETEVSLDFSRDLKYLNNEKYSYFINKYDEVARMLSSMINNPDKFLSLKTQYSLLPTAYFGNRLN